MEGEITYNNDFQKTDNIFEDLKWILVTMPVFVFIIIVFLIRNYVKDRSYKILVEEQKKIDNINDKLKIIEQIEKDQQNNLNLIQYPMNYRGKLDIANVIAYYDNRRADTLKEALNLLESDKQHQELMKVQKNMLVTINNLDQKIALVSKDVKSIKHTTKVGATFTILDYIQK